MRNLTPYPLLVLLATALLPTANAQQMVVRDAALLSCGQLLEAVERPAGRNLIADWTNGYVTAYNYYAEQKIQPSDNLSSIAFVKSYCRSNPLHILLQAGAVLVQDLGGKEALHQYKP